MSAVKLAPPTVANHEELKTLKEMIMETIYGVDYASFRL